MSKAKKGDKSDPRCPRAESVAACVLGELAGDELARFEDHLAECDACRREVAEFREVVRRMRELEPEPLARDLAPAILAKIEEREERGAGRPRSRILTLTRIAAVAASLLVALAGGWVLLSRRRPESREMPPAARAPSPEVLRALDWLASSQEQDGSWDAGRWGGQDTYTVGLSGLAVLAFLGAGETHLDGPHARTVERGLGCLLRRQGAKGRFGPFFGAALYNHGIASVTLLEAYARTRDATLKAPIGRALEFIVRRQGEGGGWGYLGERGPANTSVTAWQLHALLLAASLEWPEAEAPAGKGLAWLEGVVAADGLAGYRRPGDHPNGPETLTAMTALLLSVGGGPVGRVRQMAGRRGVDSEGMRALRSLVRLTSRPSKGTDFYRSYFLTHAFRVAEADGHAETPARAEPLVRLLVRRQLAAGPDSGSWSPSDRWGQTGGRVYSTAMAALSLEAGSRDPLGRASGSGDFYGLLRNRLRRSPGATP